VVAAPRTRPSLRREKALLRETGLRETGPREAGLLVAGCDEVGRGALAGPVTVGVVVVDAHVRRMPPGLNDSKLLTPARREQLVPKILRWCRASAVGHAAPQEIDAFGLTRALRLAGMRALADLRLAWGVGPDVLLLDGSHDWLSAREMADAQPGLWVDETVPEPPWPEVDTPPVVTQVKADLTCASVAAASVLAKTTRDALMRDLAATHPEFGWEENKGYASDQHRAALQHHGPCTHHRRTWRLTAGADSVDITAAEGVDR
jgi:ribonuclease HII